MGLKYKELADLLRDSLTRYAVGERLPSEEALRKKYGLSRETVRHAMSLLCAEGLIERRRGSGAYKTAADQPREAAILLSFPEDGASPSLLRDAEQTLAARGVSLRAYATGGQYGREREVLRQLLEEPPCGLLVEGIRTALPSPNRPFYESLRQKGVPLVFLNAAYRGLDAPEVFADREGAARELARRLSDMGCRRLAAIFPSDDETALRRFDALLRALTPELADRVLWCGEEQLLAARGGDIAFFLPFLEALDGCDALILDTDELAYRLARSCRIPMAVLERGAYSELLPDSTLFARRRSHPGALAADLLLERLRAGR